jgi:hypothetical protein
LYATSTLSPRPATLALFDDSTEQSKIDLAAVALRLVQAYALLYASSEAFDEIFQPVVDLLADARMKSVEIKVSCIWGQTDYSVFSLPRCLISHVCCRSRGMHVNHLPCKLTNRFPFPPIPRASRKATLSTNTTIRTRSATLLPSSRRSTRRSGKVLSENCAKTTSFWLEKRPGNNLRLMQLIPPRCAGSRGPLIWSELRKRQWRGRNPETSEGQVEDRRCDRDPLDAVLSVQRTEAKFNSTFPQLTLESVVSFLISIQPTSVMTSQVEPPLPVSSTAVAADLLAIRLLHIVTISFRIQLASTYRLYLYLCSSRRPPRSVQHDFKLCGRSFRI